MLPIDFALEYYKFFADEGLIKEKCLNIVMQDMMINFINLNLMGVII